MSNVIEKLPPEMQSLFTEIIANYNLDLLKDLQTRDEPTPKERIAVHELLSDEFSRCLKDDDEPTDRGVEVDKLLGMFLRLWPVQGQWFDTNWKF